MVRLIDANLVHTDIRITHSPNADRKKRQVEVPSPNDLTAITHDLVLEDLRSPTVRKRVEFRRISSHAHHFH